MELAIELVKYPEHMTAAAIMVTCLQLVQLLSAQLTKPEAPGTNTTTMSVKLA